MIKIVRLILGILFYIAGGIGLVLPVVPQVPFLILGTVFLMTGSRRFAVWIRSKRFFQEYAEPFLEKNRFLSSLISEE